MASRRSVVARPSGQPETSAFRRIEQHPELGDLSVDHFSHIAPRDGNRTICRTGLPCQHPEAVMPHGVALRLETKRRPELLQESARDLRDGRTPSYDIGRFVHDRLSHEEFRNGFRALPGITFIEDTLQIRMQKVIVVRFFGQMHVVIRIGHVVHRLVRGMAATMTPL
ncbi:hypothetical protein ABNQ38_34675 (plasmid) [Azospirillum sp. A29]|uniref:hypothetical protein n=1 Tax=Azospirillum sp. A29 TaxID=3160606 RepID=UPI0036724E6D